MDYNIYIHDKTNGGSASHTKAWSSGGGNSSKASASNQGESKGLQTFQKVASVVSNPDSLISKAGGIAKQVGWIYAAYLAAKITFNIAQEQVNYISRETGDYRGAIAMSNIKNGLQAVFNPFATVKGLLENRQEVSLYNKRQEQQRLLIGENLTNGSVRRV